MDLVKKVNSNENYTCILGFFFPFCPGQTEEWTESEGERKGDAGKDLMDPFQRWVLVGSLPSERDIVILQNSGQYSGPIYFIFLLRWVGELM